MIEVKEAIEKAVKEFDSRGLMHGLLDNGLKDLGDKYILTGTPFPGEEREITVCCVSIEKETGELESYDKFSDENIYKYSSGKYLDIPNEYVVDIKLDRDSLIKCIKELGPQEHSFISFNYRGRYCGIHLKNYYEEELFRNETKYVIFCGDMFLARTSIEGVLEGEVFDGKCILEVLDDIEDFNWRNGRGYVYNVEFSTEESEIFEDYESENDDLFLLSTGDYLKLVLFEKLKDEGFIDSLPKDTARIKQEMKENVEEYNKESVWIKLDKKEYAMVGAYAAQNGLSVVEAFKKAMKDDITKWVSDCESDNQ
ncbi:MAG: hypothetical protein IJ883_01970 [Eubacterium sp.]|nr:hypothetical protein [Eubacterium sp.]